MLFITLHYSLVLYIFFFFNDTATTEIYTLSLHDALPIYRHHDKRPPRSLRRHSRGAGRSEEHTSELQSRVDLVCRLLLEKKKKNISRVNFYKKKKKNKIKFTKNNIKNFYNYIYILVQYY